MCLLNSQLQGMHLGSLKLSHFGFDVRESELNLVDFANDAIQLRRKPFPLYVFWTSYPVIKQPSKFRFVAGCVGSICLSHHCSSAESLVVVGRKVGMNELRQVAI